MNSASTTKARTPKSDSAGLSSSLGRALFQQRIEAVLLHTKEATHADGVAVSLKGDGDEFICRASVGCAPEIGVTLLPGQGLCGRCIEQAAALVEDALEGDIKSVAAVPVMNNGLVFGLVAGFSLEPNAFPHAAIREFEQLAQRIQSEVEPLAVELSPADSDEEVMAKLGLDVSGMQPQTQLPAEEDDAYLTDLVREVLRPSPAEPSDVNFEDPSSRLDTPISDTPISDTPNAQAERSADDILRELLEECLGEAQRPVQPDAPVQELSAEEASAEAAEQSAPPPILPTEETQVATSEPPQPISQPAPFIQKPRSRTTEEVLMEVVETPAAPKRSKRIDKSKFRPVPVNPPAIAQEKEPQPAIAPVVTEPQPVAAAESATKLPGRSLVISAAAVVALAILSTAIFYLRTPSKPQPQPQAQVQQQAAQPATSTPQSTARAPVEPTKPASGSKQAQQGRKPEQRPKADESALAPIVVATTGGPVRSNNEDAAPVALTGVDGKQSAPVLPSAEPTVTFGGRQSTGTVPPKLVQRFDPIFPALGRTMHLSGDVQMEALVGADGRVVSITNVKGHNVLASAAVDAVKKWRYEPAKQDGKNVESIVQVIVRFR